MQFRQVVHSLMGVLLSKKIIQIPQIKRRFQVMFLSLASPNFVLTFVAPPPPPPARSSCSSACLLISLMTLSTLPRSSSLSQRRRPPLRASASSPPPPPPPPPPPLLRPSMDLRRWRWWKPPTSPSHPLSKETRFLRWRCKVDDETC